jgi:ABC-type nitrate/sulfonate/bicarbonate transport system permease component
MNVNPGGNALVNRLISIATPLVLLAAWELAARAHAIDTRFFSSPTQIFAQFWEMLTNGELLHHTMATVTRVLIGFVIGTAIGIILGLAIGLIPSVAAALQPLIDATFPIPKVGLLPLVIILFGIGEASKYAIIAISVVYLIIINTAAGVRQIERIYLDVGRNYHASRLMMFTDVAFPGALPSIFTGMKVSMGVSLIVIVTAESLAAKSGIGFLIWTSWQVFEVEKMYVGLFVSAILGFGSSMLLAWLERRLIPWKHA